MRNLLVPVIFLLLIPGFVLANPCSFRTADYRVEMQDLASVRGIDIDVNKSRKWAKNGLGILLDPAVNIPASYKKKFKASVRVHYDFGTCDYTAKVRQNGDHRDHIVYKNGTISQSLDVKLDDGNIASVVRFKMFLPKTRNGSFEVFGVQLFRKMGIIAPRTSLVHATVNGARQWYIFQEKESKELLESAARREGPIFEGDEAISWSFDGFKDLSLAHVSGVRLVNDKWFGKGQASKDMTVRAFLSLQDDYLKAHHNFRTGYYFQPSQFSENSTNRFAEYHALTLAMRGHHGLAPHNRKFYWNALDDQFEPIYYDGNFAIQMQTRESLFTVAVGAENEDEFYFLHEMADVDFDELGTRISDVIDAEFRAEFAGLMGLNPTDVSSWIANSKKVVLANISMIGQLVERQKAQNWQPPVSASTDQARDRVFKFTQNNSVPQKFVELTSMRADGTITLTCLAGETCVLDDVTPTEFQDLVSDNMLRGRRFVLVGSAVEFAPDYATTPFLDGHILHSAGAVVGIDAARRTMTLEQAKSDDWFLIRNTDLSDYSIELKGIGRDTEVTASGQRINDLGLTGCLTLYSVTLSGTSVSVDAGGCEDGLNIVSSKGELAEVIVTNAFSDAIDIDFSALTIDSIKVRRAGNDCLDLSGGQYNFGQVDVSGCGDKGVSVGEASEVVTAKLIVSDAVKGLSSKDYSLVTLDSFSAFGTEICLEAFQKKPEFGGGQIVANNGTCDTQKIFVDDNSVVLLNGVRHELSN